ncbi:hypothetical protein BLNAU_24812 [Blattamonas nauphoetae]|uniref:Uncharacterized protein n=1 Tax=Blattamonas nauphoetae TaxID=2049346 RepID=A0ABQ9WLD6_9EUKA|nr:hypothetical protein BLNAU_24812 [Blattamonas nauphoetae]
MRGRRDEDENDSLEEYQTSEENEWLKQESKRLNEQNNNSKPKNALEEERRRGAKNEWDIPGEEEAETGGLAKREEEERTSSQCPHSLLSLLWKVGQCQTMQATLSA